MAELNGIEAKYTTELLPENKRLPQSGAIFSCRELCTVSDFGRNRKAFVMRAFDGNSDVSDGDHVVEDENGEDLKCTSHSLQLETDLTRLPRHSDIETANDELDLEAAAIQLVSGMEVVEGSLFELERERALKVQELKTRERQISLRLRQISGTQEQVRDKANELIQLVTDRRFPSSILLMGFAEKAVSQCETQTLDLNSVAFALAHVIVLVTSQVPDAMELILAEFHKSCIFTVPKYIPYAKNAFDSENAYYKAVGYGEDNGKLESTDNYVACMKAYIALYAAIIQADIPGIKNFHGIKEGWAWFARFLNVLPPNRVTGAALESFLKIAGFRLFQAYPKPFIKIMPFIKIIDLISRDFLVKLKSQKDPDSNRLINNIETYVITQQFRKEPKDHTLAITDESKNFRA